MAKILRAAWAAFFLALTPHAAPARDKVAEDLKAFDRHVAALRRAFAAKPADPKNKEWAKAKLAHMVEVDQYMRKYPAITKTHAYTAEEEQAFLKVFFPKWTEIDTAHTRELKALLKIYKWFTIGAFGKEADMNAWLLAQHADQDPAFQKQVLEILEPLHKSGETSPANYAYLFDRVASSHSDPARRKPQRYGSQGECTGPGTWTPLPIEDPSRLDERRKSVGLEPFADYVAKFKDICK
jgi:hypothetical protein